MNTRNTLLWLRAETKVFEQRTLLTPAIAGQLIEHGYQVVVERSDQRIFDDVDFANAGCRLVNAHTWKNAPKEAIILGLKELDPNDGPFTRRHVHFAHVYKEQQGWQDTLRQFQHGGGVLYDLEFLTDESGKRLAAFGYWAGFVGAALAVLALCGKTVGKPLAPLSAWSDKDALVATVVAELEKLTNKPNALVIGALGRCGSGAMELLSRCGIEATAWDQEETLTGGPFDAVRDHDILINCVFVNIAMPPFTTLEHLRKPVRRLQVISDVSCDPFGQYNPLPVYQQCTSMGQPSIEILPSDGTQASLDLVAIDHLPSLLPRESCQDFASQLLATLLNIDKLNTGAWQRAEQVFQHHMAQLPPREKNF